MTMEQVIQKCRKPFTPNRVQTKIQATFGEKILAVSYVDARTVSERLNFILPAGWNTEFREVPDGVVCRITLRVGDTSIRREDIGTLDGGEYMGGRKSMYSDAFKRAAVHFGVGVSLYALPQMYIPEEKDGKTLLKKNAKGKFYLPDSTQKMCRDKYSKWLTDTGIDQFGEPLDQGD